VDEQLPEPTGIGLGIVVEERHNVAPGGSYARVARTGKSSAFLVSDDFDVVRERSTSSLQQLFVVVDDDDALFRWAALGAQRIHGLQQRLPTALCI
jgi:hypothetical protein